MGLSLQWYLMLTSWQLALVLLEVQQVEPWLAQL